MNVFTSTERRKVTNLPPQGPPPGQPYPPQNPQGYPQPGQWQQPAEPPKKKFGCMKIGLIVLGVLIVLGIIVTIATRGGDDGSSSITGSTSETQASAAPAGDATPAPAAEAPAEESPADSGLRFEAETSGGTTMDITYVGKDFNITQQQGQASPWQVSVDVNSKFDIMGANMSAQNNGGGDVTCRVYWDGELVNENTSTGEYAIVMCSLPM